MVCWLSGPPHSTKAMAMRPWVPAAIAFRTFGSENAVAYPSRCRRSSSSSIEPDPSDAKTSSRSTVSARTAGAIRIQGTAAITAIAVENQRQTFRAGQTEKAAHIAERKRSEEHRGGNEDV